MKKRITVTVAGNEYRLMSAENEEYTRKVASTVDAKISEILQLGNISIVDAAVLASINLADDYYKVLDTADNLRAQLKDYLEESGRMKIEIADLRRENERLKNK